MGRYDKIQVHDGVSFKRPKRIRVYSDNAWQDLGDELSDNLRSFLVHNGSNFVRATLNKTIINVVGDSYAAGDGFQVLPLNGYCYCPTSSSGVGHSWFFRCAIRKEADTFQGVLYVGNPEQTCYIKVDWLANGCIQVTCDSIYASGGPQIITTTNSVGKGIWVNLNIYVWKGSYNMVVEWNGTVTQGSMWQTFVIANAYNWIGTVGLKFKYPLEIQGTQYYNNSCYKWIDMTTAAGSNNDYGGVDHVDDSRQEITWT